MASTVLFLAALLALPCQESRAQGHGGISITAEVDKTTVSLSDTLTLTVTVTGSSSDLPEPELPSLPNFNVYSSGQSNNISIINGRVSSSLTYIYSLSPRFVGKATIQPVRLRANGQTFQTEPIDVTIVPANRPSQAAPRQLRPARGNRTTAARSRQQQEDSGNEAFVKAYVSKRNPYVNEQTTLTVRFYTSVPLMGNPQYTPPTMRAMLSEDLPPVRTGSETINGRNYQYSEIKTALFGATAGKAEIASAKVLFQPRTDDMIDPDMPDFFQRFFSQGLSGAQTKQTVTAPIALDIKPLPEAGKPSNFSGAVGKYSITASADVKDLKAGEALNLIVTISGTGNLKTISAPPLPDLQNFRAYDTVASLNMTKTGDLVQGSKTFKTVLIPKTSGVLQLPPVQFSYFDPEDGAYHTEETKPIQIKVAPGAPQAQAVYATANGGGGASVTTLGEDIRYIAENKKPSAVARALSVVNSLGKINFLPFILFMLSAAAAFAARHTKGDAALLKFKKAYSSAKAPVKNAERLFSQGHVSQGAAALSEALNTYLCGKLGCPLGSLRLKEIEERLKNSSELLRPETLEKLERLWQELELLRFAPSQVDQDRLKALPQEMLHLFAKLEKELRK